MFEQYPKCRPPLSDAIAAVYAEQYKSNRDGGTTASSMAQRVESWMHRQVARDVVDGRMPRSTLELGAGTLNQLPFEPESGPYDIIEPFTELYAGSPLLPRVRNAWTDIADVPHDSRYDRITSIAALEHICDLPSVVARCGVLLSPHGQLRVAIPSEGTFLWTLGWKITTGLEFRLRHGLDYGDLMRHEHVNTARDVRDVLHHFFGDVRCKSFGPAPSFSLYQFYVCSSPIMTRCDAHQVAART